MGVLALFLLPLPEASAQYEVSNTPIRYQRGYIHLKDGSILKGKYAFSSSLEKVRVASDHQIQIFDAVEIEKITTRRPPQVFEDDPATRESLTAVVPPSPWFNHTELGVLAGNNDNNQPAPLVFGTSLNRIIKGNLSAGAGFGVEFLNETYIPLTVNLMYRLRNTRLSPFAMVQGGYQVPVEDSRTLYQSVVPEYVYSSSIWPGPRPSYNSEMKAKGGFLFNPSFGIMNNISQGFGMSLAFGYRFHRLHYKGEDDYRIDVDYNRLSIKLGFIFN